MTQKLKPCPFCGEKEDIEVFWYSPSSVSVSCSHCNCYGPYKEIPEFAIKAWNRRAGEE